MTTSPSTSTDAPAETAHPVSPLLQRPGAVADEGPDAGVAAHYGDPLREQRLLAEGLAAVDLSHRGVLTVTGPDRLSWLHSLTTQQLTDLPPRHSTEALILTPKGRIEHDLHVVDDGETTWITVEPGAAAAAAAWLDSMRFMLRVEVHDVTADFGVLGEPIGAEMAEGEPVAWVDPWPAVVGDSTAYSDVAEHPGTERVWRELVVPRDRLAEAVGDRPLAGAWAAEALRVAAWRPRLGLETDNRSIPHELDWLRTAVHLHKGCYRGQETVARVKNLGRPPRRIAFVHLDGSGHVLPDRDSDVVLDGRTVGRLTSVARHFEDGPIGLVVVKRNTPTDADFVIGGVSAAQTEIVRQ
ncbi:MAG TPA: folate-binding protein [Segeticoccus sp.]|uniref:CAF17-like 4Fe-4S cluster assembly/insertion protein YgfZ n=1 Tax=Segeticoccus sp. TaxID=2706531 RepID=UPI002D7F26D3|nr:folate-binding protein [Segeticoccus sp.]HET8601320.1 folate-binding protein [Segeticoccus sp.]